MSTRPEHVKAWRKATKERMVAAMGGKCQCCGYDRCMESLDFHHIDPKEKEMSLGSIRANPRAWPVIVNELRKCVLVCRNCHGELHYGLRELPVAYARFDERYLDYRHHPDLCDLCPECGKSKPKHHRFCSPSCGANNRIPWDQYDLVSLAAAHTVTQIAVLVNGSHAAVTRALCKRGLKAVQPTQVVQRTVTPFVYDRPPKKAQSKPSQINPEWRRCPHPARRKVARPSKEDLTRMVWETSLAAVGRHYSVRDNTIRKWCKSYGIELPPQGYAQRRAAGYSHEESMNSQKRTLKGKRFITREIAEQAFAMKREQNLSYRAVAAAFGFGHWGIQQAFRRYGLE